MRLIFKNSICLIFIVFFLFSCTQKPKDTNKIELEFWTLQLASFDSYINDLIDSYEAENPDIKIKWIDVPFKEGEKRALVAAMSKKVPDLINLNPTFSSTLASKKAIINFNDYINQEQKDEYLQAAWQSCSLGDYMFGVPWYITSSITVYNKKNLAAAGIDAPPKNYSELIGQSKIIKKKLNKYAFLPTLTEGDYFLKLMVKNNIKIISDLPPHKAIFDTDEAVSFLSEWVNLYKDDIVPSESIVANHQQAVDKFQSGVNTFILIGPNFIKTIKDNSPRLFKEIDVSPQIVGSTGKVDFSVMNFIVPIKSKHKKEAVKFALFVTNSKNQLAFSKITPTLPSSINALNDEFFSYSDNKSLEDRARLISANQLKEGAQPLPVLRNQQELLSILNYYVQKAMLDKISPYNALKETCKKWNDLLTK